mgnify:CR=1 FL=1
MDQRFQFTDPFQLPESAQKVIPQELGGDFLASLNRSMDLQQQKSQEDLLGFQEQRGLLRSGDTNRRLIEDVLGPYDERRRQALLGIAVPAAQQGQEQAYKKEFQTMLFQQQLQELQKRYELNRQLEILRGQLEEQQQPSMMSGIGQKFAGAIGAGAGGIAIGMTGGLLNWMKSQNSYGTTSTGGGNTAAFGPSANFY